MRLFLFLYPVIFLNVKGFFSFQMILALVVSAVSMSRVESAQDVVSELVILVDAQAGNDFDLIQESVAQAFEQQEIIDAVSAGNGIATSVVYFNRQNNNGPNNSLQNEEIVIPWAELSSVSDLQNFAALIRSLNNPNGFGNVNYASAIVTANEILAASTVQGSRRQITIIDDGSGFFPANPAATQAAATQALADSTDVINALVFGLDQPQVAQDFFEDNVVGSTGEVEVLPARVNGGAQTLDPAIVTDSIVQSIASDFVLESFSIPEPSPALLVGICLAIFGLRRVRKSKV